MPNVAGRFTCRFGHFPYGPFKFRLGDSECKQEFSRGVADKAKTTNFEREGVGSPAPNPALDLKGHVPGELTNLRFEEPLRGSQAEPATAGSREASREKMDWFSKDRIRSVRLSDANPDMRFQSA